MLLDPYALPGPTKPQRPFSVTLPFRRAYFKHLKGLTALGAVVPLKLNLFNAACHSTSSSEVYISGGMFCQCESAAFNKADQVFFVQGLARPDSEPGVVKRIFQNGALMAILTMVIPARYTATQPCISFSFLARCRGPCQQPTPSRQLPIEKRLKSPTPLA